VILMTFLIGRESICRYCINKSSKLLSSFLMTCFTMSLSFIGVLATSLFPRIFLLSPQSWYFFTALVAHSHRPSTQHRELHSNLITSHRMNFNYHTAIHLPISKTFLVSQLPPYPTDSTQFPSSAPLSSSPKLTN
jgi:hypothetical protein